MMTRFLEASQPLCAVAAAMLVLSCAGCGATIEGSPLSSTPEGAKLAVVPVPPSRQEMRDLTSAEKATLADGFVSGLDNPDATKFRWAKIPKLLNDAAVGSFEYCGMVNVKNSNGGFDGWQPFLATITTAGGVITGGAIAALNAGNRPENRDVIPKLCHQKGLDPVAVN
jgi:hypothetical protein